MATQVQHQTTAGHETTAEQRPTLFIVRHGERIDETSNKAVWRAQTPRNRLFDPPLTETGAGQARAAAEFLRTRSFDRIYASPCARTLATAKELSEALHLPVTVVPALAACAAAVKKKGLGNLPFLKQTEMTSMCPGIDSFGADAPLGFEGACSWVAARSPQALVVSHREGIRDLAREKLSLPYCAVGVFEQCGAQDWVLKALHRNTGELLVSRARDPPRRAPPPSNNRKK